MTVSIPKRLLRPLAAIVAASAGFAFFTPRAEAEDANVEVLTRGPVHEAFASAVNYEAKPGIIVSAKVPEAIEEMPPDEQPEGNNVTWIPGYWAWDDERNQFIWISGVWRNVPPGRQWVPGYWNDLGDGRSQWVSGYWASTEQKEATYVETAPPENIDHGPNIEAPSSDHSWIPGYWYWADTRYVWRPGYWLPLGQHWTWVPPYYSWTPCGYAYVSGYWDYAIAGRGVLYAPVCFRGGYYPGVAYSYVPWVTVGLSVFSDHLFYRPYCGHYYFGDYYAPYYAGCGYYASYAWNSGCHGYDPIYCHNRWVNRGNPNWERGVYGDFEYFRNHENARPAHTFEEMKKGRTDQFGNGSRNQFASSLRGSERQDGGTRFRKLDDQRRTELVSQSREIQNFSRQRRQQESVKPDAIASSGKTVQRGANPSPIRSRQASELSANDTPPARRIASNANAIAASGMIRASGKESQIRPTVETNHQRTQRAFDAMSRPNNRQGSGSVVPPPRREQVAPSRVPNRISPPASSGITGTRSVPRPQMTPSVRPQIHRSGGNSYFPSSGFRSGTGSSYSGGGGRLSPTMPSVSRGFSQPRVQSSGGSFRQGTTNPDARGSGRKR